MWITRVSIRHPVFAAMVMVALCVLGLFAYQRLGIEQLPDISPPVVSLYIRYPGATPEAVEREVAKPVEEAVNTIAGVTKIMSRSEEGVFRANVEFSLDTDMGRAVQDVRDRMAMVQPALPRDVKAPSVQRMDSEEQRPLTELALVDGTRSARELTVLADEQVIKPLQRVAGVARVDASGLAQREVRVQLDPERLKLHGLTPAEIATALRAANADSPVGVLSDVANEAILRVEARVRDPRAFADLPVARRGTLVVRLADVAEVIEREQEAHSLARVNGQRAIALRLFKQQDANLVQVGEAVKERVEAVRKTLPAGTELRVIYASSDWVKGSLTGLRHTLFEGAALTVAIVFLFLHSWRSTVITGLTLPIAVIASFIAVYAFGYTLNFMTMMALSLCIGLLIDDAIVVRENIVRHAAMGKGHLAAARDGTEEIGLAVMATTLAICAVFVPIAFMGGIVGRFFNPFGITVVVAVLISLFVSFTLDPMLSSIWADPPNARLARTPVVGGLMRAVDRGMDRLHAFYARMIDWTFSGRRWRMPWPAWGRPFDAAGQRQRQQPRAWRRATLTPRGVVMGVASLSLVAALGLMPLVGSEFVPETDQGFTSLSLTLPVGSSLERTDAKARQVEALVRAFPEVKTVSTHVGGGQRNTADLSIALVDRSERQRSQKEIEDALRQAVAPIAGLEMTVGWNRPIYIALLGSDPQALAQAADSLAAKIRLIPGAVDVESSVKPGVPAYAVRLKPEAVRELGLNAAALGATLRAYVEGDAATQWTAPDGARLDVVLRLDEAQRRRVAQLATLPVAYTANGTAVTLERVAEIVAVENPSIIRRQNLQRREAVFAGVKGRPTGDVNAEVQKVVEGMTLPPGVSFDVGGAAKEQKEAFSNLLAAMVLAAVFIYLVLASQFGSFLQPLAIMASLPLALIGVMLALLLWRSTLNLFSMIGLVMLMGLVTKNAILLVDRTNQMRRDGLALVPALREAGQTRMRPIVMTTAAMVFGMLPLALALNDGGELQAPMGRAIIGGVLTSAVLTLWVVPVLYSYVARKPLRPIPDLDAAR